ncbi:MAG: hypothetical protein OEY79_04310 [Anaplasmataceae bacterium]|nr:hypothetical protein [Anaplasmataceae bacterium]
MTSIINARMMSVIKLDFPNFYISDDDSSMVEIISFYDFRVIFEEFQERQDFFVKN